MMITRYAMFAGTVKDGKDAAMRDWVSAHLAPLWRQFAAAVDVQILFGAQQDAAGPVLPLMLAVTYPDEAAMAQGLASPARYASRDLLPTFYDMFFDDIVLWHYVMQIAGADDS